MPKRSRTKNKKTAVKMKEEEEEEKEEYEVKVEEPGDFEKWRQQIIARNRAKLQSLGINTMLEEIAQAVGDEKKAKKQKKESQKKQKQIDEPSRKSSRLTTQKEERIQQEEDEQQKLGKFIIDGVCPKCFRVITKGHKTHLGTCRGPAPVKEKRVPTIKQLIDKEEQNKQKLKELELDGLVDINDEVALFIVIGSTGNYYKVRFFTNGRRTCQCPDHRCRKHDCKHIRLILADLEVEEDTCKWKQALDEKIKAECEKYQISSEE